MNIEKKNLFAHAYVRLNMHCGLSTKVNCCCLKLKFIIENEDVYSWSKFKKSWIKFVQEIFFQIMFEGIKIVTSLSCVRGFVKKLDQYQTKQTDRY